MRSLKPVVFLYRWLVIDVVILFALVGCTNLQRQIPSTPSEYLPEMAESTGIVVVADNVGYEGAVEHGWIGNAPGAHSPATDWLELAGEVTLDPSAVIGQDNRTRVTPTTSYPWRAIARLVMTFPNNKTYVGTGFFIGPHTVITAAHCVYSHDDGGWATSVEVIPGMDGTLRPYGSAYAVLLAVPTYWISTGGNKNWDIGAVRLADDTLGNQVGWFGFAAYGYTDLIGELANLSGYPADKSPTGSQWYSYCSIITTGHWTNGDETILYHNLDTYGGQSGSPIWFVRDSNRYVIGVHTSSWGSAYNAALRIRPHIFSLMVYWKYNW